MKNQKTNSSKLIEFAEEPAQPDPAKKPKRSGNIFDAYLRNTFMTVVFFVDFIRHYAKPGIFERLDWDTLRLFSPHSFDINGEERIADMVFVCDLKKGDSNVAAVSIVVIIEHMGGSLFYLPKRFLEYLVGVWNIVAGKEKRRKPLPSPYFMLIRTGYKGMTKEEQKGKYPKTSDMCASDTVFDDIVKGLDFDYTVVSLPDIDLDDLAGGPIVKAALGVAKVLTENRPEDLQRALIPLIQCKDYEQRRDILLRALTLFEKFLKSRGKKLNEQLLDQTIGTVLKGKEKEDMIMSIFDEKKLEGKIEGEAKGKAAGEAEAVVAILNERFKSVPKPIYKKVDAIRERQDAGKLLSLVRTAVTCKSIKDFQNALN
ncbi:MAG: Rpn family recombination-promoting nuclease/putative transposase [Planctomycetaceae bacterium]|nr:Rpn family recombination-promoting nuclease/putative transposase [Planctomycetaceae bacterium]